MDKRASVQEVSPEIDVGAFIQNFMLDQQQPSEIIKLGERHAERYDSSPFLYDDVAELVSGILDSEDKPSRVSIWVEQKAKSAPWNIRKSGILGQRRKLKDRGRLTVRVVEQKSAAFSQIVTGFYEKGIRQVVVVDNNRETLEDLFKSNDVPKDCVIMPIWVNRSNQKDGIRLNNGIVEVGNLTQLKKLAQEQNFIDHTGWIFDWDRTLIDSQKQIESIAKDLSIRLKLLIAKGVPVEVAFALDPLSVEHIIDVAHLSPGMSGSILQKVSMRTGKNVVVKHNPKEPYKIQKEIRGRALLESHGYKDVILDPIYQKEEGVVPFVAFPFNPGINFQEGLLDKTLSEEQAAQVVASIIGQKVKLWGLQEKKPVNPETFISMHRAIWESTLAQLPQGITLVAQKFGVNPEAIRNMPILYKGEQGVSLNDVVSNLSNFIKTNPPYTIVSHNDASAGNIFVNLAGANVDYWTLIDYEWAGPSDPAEALTRVVKHKTTTYLQNVKNAGLIQESGALKINLDGDWPPSVVAAQNEGMGRLEIFPELFQDPDFKTRFYSYLSCLYLREFAFAPMRLKEIEAALYPLAMTIYYMNRSLKGS